MRAVLTTAKSIKAKTKVDFRVKCEKIGTDITNYCTSSELFALAQARVNAFK